MKKIIKDNYKRFLEISLALIMVIALSSHALIYQAMAIQWQKIFQEARQWQIASDADPLTTLRPEANDGTNDNVEDEAGGAIDLWSAVDEDPDDLPGGSDGHNIVNDDDEKDGTIYLNFSTIAEGDFGTMATLFIDYYVNAPSGFADDTCTVYAQVVESDESTPLTDQVTIADQNSGAAHYASVELTNPSGAANKATWDAGFLKIYWDYTGTGKGDNGLIPIAAIELDGTYNVAAVESITFTIESGGSIDFGTVSYGTRYYETYTTQLKVDTDSADGYTISVGRDRSSPDTTLASAADPATYNIDDDVADGIDVFAGLGPPCAAATWPGAGVSSGLGFTLWASDIDKDADCWGAGSAVDDNLNRYAALQASVSADNFLVTDDILTNPSYASVGWSIEVSAIQKPTVYSGFVIFKATTNP